MNLYYKFTLTLKEIYFDCKVRYTIRIICFFSALLFQMNMFGQVELNRIVPPNPNVASIMKSEVTPVVEYAGLPSVGIPIYQINSDNVKVPISLSYHTGGILVSEESGIVGLGWSLSSGGVITRSIQGFADFGEDPNHAHHEWIGNTEPIPDPVLSTIGSDTYFNLDNNSFIQFDSNCQLEVNGVNHQYHTLHDLTANQDSDQIADTFNYSFLGKSGSFIIKKDGSVFSLDKNTFDIKWQTESGLFNYSFEITGDDGTKYFFKKWAKTNTSVHESSLKYISTWYLTKIVTTNNKEINFVYDESKEKSYPLRTFWQTYYDPGSYIDGHAPQSEVDNLYLTEINFEEGKVEFDYSNQGERLDDPKGYFLKSITVLDKNDAEIKHLDFEYSYFGSASASVPTIMGGDFGNDIGFNAYDNPSRNLRLRLDRIVENQKHKHEFYYHDMPSLSIPNKTTMSQDYWGFYNGITNGQSFIPYGGYNGSGIPVVAERYPVESKTKLFSLYRIKYPTSGYTEFEYETNTYNTTLTSIPQQYMESSPTVPEKESVNTLGGAAIITKTFNPKLSLQVRFDLAIYGSNVEDRYNHPFDFGNDMYVRVRKPDGSILWTRNIPHQQGYTDFVQTGQAFYSETLDFGSSLEIGNYTLEVYFNDHNQLYFGMAQATATWQQINVSNSENYALGGGLRVNSITDFNYNGDVLRKRKFKYHYTQLDNGEEVNYSYGRLKTFPRYDLESLPMSMGPIGPPTHTAVARVYSHNSFSKSFGSYVGYDQVETTWVDYNDNKNGMQISKYYNLSGFDADNNVGVPYPQNLYRFPTIELPHNGLLYEQEIYNKDQNDNFNLIKKTEVGYNINDIDADNFDFQALFRTSDFVMNAIHQDFYYPAEQNDCLKQIFQFYPMYSNKVLRTSQKETIFDESGQNPVVVEQSFKYENLNNYLPTKTNIIDSEGTELITKTIYPDDINTTTKLVDNSNIVGGAIDPDAFDAVERMQKDDLHQVVVPIQVETYKKVGSTETLLSIQRTNFEERTNDIIVPEQVQTSKGTTSLDARIIYHDYDDYGNPLEISKADGSHIFYVWGYDHSQPIAKIENFTSINPSQQTAINAAITASDIDTDQTTEGNLREKLEDLQAAFPDAIVTTYTYDPLIGVTSITDPRGNTMFYQYDEFNRLEFILDSDHHILSENKYHYKSEE